jgi:hypothetical protein
MKLKFELVNGYGILVDGESDPFLLPVGKTVLHVEDGYRGFRKIEKDTILGFILSGKRIYWEVVFAEKELGIDVLVFDWRDFEVEKLANEKYNDPLVFSNGNIKKLGFKEGYKSNPAKYTEEDIERAFIVGLNCSQEISLKGLPTDEGLDYQYKKLNQFIQSLQKHPKYVVMEDYCTYGDDCPSKGAYDKQHLCNVEYKLFTNSEGKQQGTVKELIWK